MDCALFSARSGPKKGDGARQGRGAPAERSAQVAQPQLRLGDALGERLGVERLGALGLAPDAADAETYDPNRLAALGVRGIRGDPERAKALYAEALAEGVAEARLRLSDLR